MLGNQTGSGSTFLGAEGSSRAEGSLPRAEGSSLRAEGSSLRAEGSSLRAEGSAHAAESTEALLALIDDPATDTATLKDIAKTTRIGVRKALLDSERCPLVSSIAEDRLAFEGVDIALFVDEYSRRNISRGIIGSGHRAEAELLFSDPEFRMLDCLRTLQSLFTIYGGKKRDRKLNRHDYLRFLTDFNARSGRQEALDLPFITLLTGIRLLGQDGLVQVMTMPDVARASRTLRLLETVVGAGHSEEGARQEALLARWIAKTSRDALLAQDVSAAQGSESQQNANSCQKVFPWVPRLHDYLDRKYKRRASKRKNRPPRTLFQSRYADLVRRFNQQHVARGVRIHLARSEHELQTLGAAMAHCVGSEHNVDDAVDGRHIILHAHPVGARRKGVTCQFHPDGKLLQARGFANREAEATLTELAEDAMQEIVNHQ